MTGGPPAGPARGRREPVSKRHDRPARHAGGGGGGITAGELALVCSHYDLGVVEAVSKFRRGSRASPKVLIKSSTGLYLLKRRAQGGGHDDPFRVASSHEIQLHLARHGFPAPHLVGTKGDNNSMLQLTRRGGAQVYELFRFVPGLSYDRSARQTAEAGRTLALCHALLAGFRPAWTPPTATFHALPTIVARLDSIPGRLGRPEARPPVRALRAAYEQGAAAVEKLGIGSYPRQLVHGDWHPGNMLFRDGRVVAVVDYDSARLDQRVLDVANGALQFSITRAPSAETISSDVPPAASPTALGAPAAAPADDPSWPTGDRNDPEDWPVNLDKDRFAAFFAGYHDAPGSRLTRAEAAGLPWLMIEALIVEAAGPIAATGRFGRLDALAVLRMVERKVQWLAENAAGLAAMAFG